MLIYNLLAFLQLLAGFAFLIKGADFLVDGSASIAKKLHVSNLVIGLTIVAIGTSAPELVVNILSSLNGHSGLLIGNVIGSNITNILLVLGITAIITPLSIQKSVVSKQIPIGLFVTLLVWVAANDKFNGVLRYSVISRVDGVVLLLGFFIYLYFTMVLLKDENDIKDKIEKYKFGKSLWFVVLGVTGLTIGGFLTFKGAVQTAEILNVSDELVGLTILALGTSFPELVTAVVAALKKQPDIAVGNIVGSNIINLLLVLGLGAIINPIIFPAEYTLDLVVAVMASFLLMIVFYTGTRQVIDRLEGAFFIMVYSVYLTTLIIS